MWSAVQKDECPSCLLYRLLGLDISYKSSRIYDKDTWYVIEVYCTFSACSEVVFFHVFGCVFSACLTVVFSCIGLWFFCVFGRVFSGRSTVLFFSTHLVFPPVRMCSFHCVPLTDSLCPFGRTSCVFCSVVWSLRVGGGETRSVFVCREWWSLCVRGRGRHGYEVDGCGGGDRGGVPLGFFLQYGVSGRVSLLCEEIWGVWSWMWRSFGVGSRLHH